MNLYFMEVTIKDSGKYSFRIERLQSFRDMGSFTIIYLDSASFHINETYNEFLDRLKRYENTKASD